MSDQFRQIVRRWWAPALVTGFLLVVLLMLLIPLFLMRQPSRINPGISRAIGDIETAAVAAKAYAMERGNFPDTITALIEAGYLTRNIKQERTSLITVTANTIEIQYNGPPSGGASPEEIRRISCRRLTRSDDGKVENLPCENVE